VALTWSLPPILVTDLLGLASLMLAVNGYAREKQQLYA
jgi:hypothetical protein